MNNTVLDKVTRFLNYEEVVRLKRTSVALAAYVRSEEIVSTEPHLWWKREQRYIDNLDDFVDRDVKLDTRSLILSKSLILQNPYVIGCLIRQTPELAILAIELDPWSVIETCGLDLDTFILAAGRDPTIFWAFRDSLIM